MTKHQERLLTAYYDIHCAPDYGQRGARAVVASEVVAHLFELNKQFEPHAALIDSIAYDAAYESQTNAAVESAVFKGVSFDAQNLPPQVWRVLKERHLQYLFAAQVQAVQHNGLSVTVPDSLPEHALAAYLWLRCLVDTPLLAAPVDPASALKANIPANLTRH